LAVRAAGSRVPAFCLVVFLAVWTALAIAPRYRADWLLENLPTFVGVPLAVVGFRRFRFSDRAYLQATAFLVLHTVGSHYTYSEVPLGDWARDVFGLARNHYDRLVHFAFGLLMLRPVRELGFRPGSRPGPVALTYFSVAGVALWSLLYEVTEWLVASVADPAAGTAFLGTQGDPWDAEKDMALATGAAVIAAALDARLPVGTPAAERGARRIRSIS
jgi:putative membrane protein